MALSRDKGISSCSTLMLIYCCCFMLSCMGRSAYISNNGRGYYYMSSAICVAVFSSHITMSMVSQTLEETDSTSKKDKDINSTSGTTTS